MKKTLFAFAVAGAFSGAAFAQSTSTIYGILDIDIRHTNNQPCAAPATGACSLTKMEEGAFNGSRIGFKGTEDLGGGTSALYQIEAGYAAYNGQSGQQGQLFGRQVWAGLSDKSAGTVKFGRQYGVTFTTIGDMEVLGWGNQNENSWEAALVGIRFDNTVKYSNDFGGSPVILELQYSPGGQAGTNSLGTTEGFDVKYAQGPLSVGGVWSESKAGNSAVQTKLTNYAIGGAYDAGVAKAYVHYLNSKRDPGFAKAGSLSGGPLANTSFLNNTGNTTQRTDKYWEIGASIPAGTQWSFLVAYMYDKIDSLDSAGESGKITTAAAYADYALSKRTDVYLGLDHSSLKDAAVTAANSPIGTFAGQESRTGLDFGFRHRF
jgi:predicted porin